MQQHPNELIESLSELEAQFTAQADLFAIDGHDTEAAEQYGRSFGVARSIARVREWARYTETHIDEAGSQVDRVMRGGHDSACESRQAICHYDGSAYCASCGGLLTGDCYSAAEQPRMAAFSQILDIEPVVS